MPFDNAKTTLIIHKRPINCNRYHKTCL